jgi:hypothetical protein
VWRSYGERVAAAELWRLLRRWDGFRSRMLAFAARYDLFVCPVFPSPARLQGTMNVPGELDRTGWTTPHTLARDHVTLEPFDVAAGLGFASA